MFNYLISDANNGDGGSGWTIWVIVGVVVLLLVAMIVLPMITNKKRAKTENEKRDSLSVGDTIMTIGGIVGVVKSISEPAPNRKEFVIETGDGEKTTTITLDIKALYLIINSVNKPAEIMQPSNSSSSVENIKLIEGKPEESEKESK